jgi:hypothetical protein
MDTNATEIGPKARFHITANFVGQGHTLAFQFRDLARQVAVGLKTSIPLDCRRFALNSATLLTSAAMAMR